jgi:serine/threonine protein kinase
MKLTAAHCSDQQLDAFIGEKLSADEEARVQDHLDRCSRCRQRLCETAADESWWHLAAASLASTDSGSAATEPPAPCSDGAVVALQLKAILQPTDDPQMLGRLGNYEISGVIGRGGMGLVLKAYDPALHRYVALKVLRPDLAASASARRRFAREGKAAASVLHHNVIAIHGVAEANGLPYLVMPYLRGESLASRIAREGRLDLVEILRIGIQVCDGLAAAHAQGLVHRDVKPSNIILESGVERLKLTDFGLARTADSAGITRTGTLAGTPEFMSPEQARGESVDYRSDLFSLGIVFYVLCTGQCPFRADSCYGVIRQIVELDPPSVRSVNAGSPAWLAKLIQRLMNKRPEGRYQSAEEVARLLRHCLAHTQNPSQRVPAELLERRQQLSLAAFATLAAAFFFGSVLYWSTTGTFPSAQSMLVVPLDDAYGQRSRDADVDPTSALGSTTLPWDDDVESLLGSVRRRLSELTP